LNINILLDAPLACKLVC